MTGTPEPELRAPLAQRRDEPASEAGASTKARGLVDELTELREVVRSLASLQVARGKIALERSGLALARLALLGVAAAVLVASLVVLLVVGSVGGVAAATGWPWWLAALGLGVLGPLAAAVLAQLALGRHDSARARTLEERARAEGSRA